MRAYDDDIQYGKKERAYRDQVGSLALSFSNIFTALPS